MTTSDLPTTSEIERAINADPKSHKKRFWRRWLWLAVLFSLAVGSWFYWQSYQQSNSQVKYEDVEVTKRNLVVSITATGAIQPLTKVDISSEVSGVVREVLVNENSIVKAGDVLTRLDVTRLTAQRTRASAQLSAARARVLTAQASLKQSDLALLRQTRLRARSLSTEQEIEQAEAELTRAEAGLEVSRADVLAAESDLALVEADLTKATILSPIDGIVLKRSVEPGQTVAATLQAPILFTVAQDISRIQLEANVDEADVGVVKVGQPAMFTVDAYRDRDFPAQIERISYSPETVDGVVTYKTLLSAGNADLALRPGMTATAKVVIAKFDDALAVPNEALRFTPPRQAQSQGFSITQLFMPRFPRNERNKRVADVDGKRNVYVLIDGQPTARRVKTGATDGVYTIIVEGELKAGDRLITAIRSGGTP